MKMAIVKCDQGYYIAVNGHRINDPTEHKPKVGTIIKLCCPISSQKADIEELFAQGILLFTNSPYLSDNFIMNDNAEYFILAVLNVDIKEDNNATI